MTRLKMPLPTKLISNEIGIYDDAEPKIEDLPNDPIFGQLFDFATTQTLPKKYSRS